jgi:prepilin-type N-terminal cleavage/methylation domain-containing protein
MKRPEHNAGFTMVELLVALAAASILAITAGMTLVYGYSGWCRNNAAMELQREATLAMYRLSRAVRGASATDVTTPLAGQSAERLTIKMTDKTTEFRVDGDHLLYDPDTGIGGDEVVIVDGRLKTFTVTNLSTGTGVSTVLELQNENSDEIAITSAITTFRN